MNLILVNIFFKNCPFFFFLKCKCIFLWKEIHLSLSLSIYICICICTLGNIQKKYILLASQVLFFSNTTKNKKNLVQTILPTLGTRPSSYQVRLGRIHSKSTNPQSSSFKQPTQVNPVANVSNDLLSVHRKCSVGCLNSGKSDSSKTPKNAVCVVFFRQAKLL